MTEKLEQASDTGTQRFSPHDSVEDEDEVEYMQSRESTHKEMWGSNTKVTIGLFRFVVKECANYFDVTASKW